jgi:putative FmdB family regulatory protein
MLALPSVPIYEYKCPNGHLFEVFHGMTAPSPETCEVCGAGPLVRVLHPVAVHYKGSGFYATDYGKGAKKKEKETAGATASSDGAGGNSGSGGSDSGGATSSSGSSDSSSSPPKATEA